MKNLIKLIEKLVPLVNEKFHEQYPEIFIKPNTKDSEIYRTSVEGYTLYNKYLNSICNMYEMARYNVSSIHFSDGTDDSEKLIEDIRNCDDILKFCFFNFKI